MFSLRILFTKKTIPVFTLCFSLLWFSSCKEKTKQGPNVLFIAVDDLATNLSSYGDPIARTPNFDRLARLGVQFNNAYCQIPLCNPSRASLMTGLRPDSIKVYDLDAHFRDAVPQVMTLPQLFQEHGYWVGRVGKIYHYNVPAAIGSDGHDDPISWLEVFNPSGRDKNEEHLVVNAEPHRKISAALSWMKADGKDHEQTDGMIAIEAIRQIKKHKDEPFFLAVGFFRPHTPYIAPNNYFDLYPLSSIKMPYAPEADRTDLPSAALAHNCKLPNYGLPDSICLRAKQAYYATTSFVDAQLGLLLNALEETHLLKNTVIVLWSDHGYHLGEHGGIWQKRTLFEESAKAPLFIYAPGVAGNGSKCNEIVEFVDIYPTIRELCDLPHTDGVSGQNLAPLLEKPDLNWSGQAITQILRPGNGRPVMGRSIRTDQWRYTDWNEGIAGEELYDKLNDPGEFNNLASDPKYQSVVGKLRLDLGSKASGKIPTTPFNPGRL